MRTRIIGYQAQLDTRCNWCGPGPRLIDGLCPTCGRPSGVPIRRNVFDGPTITELREMAEADRRKCEACEVTGFKRDKRLNGEGWQSVEYWLSPFKDIEPLSEIKWVCSDRCRDSYMEDTFYCDWCEREIVQSHGHRGYMRYLPDVGAVMCVACWQRLMLEQDEWAQDRIRQFAEVVGAPIPCDFFDHGELEAHGFEEYQDIFITGIDGVRTVRGIVKNLLDEGRGVIIDQGATSIMGDEGNVTIWTRNPAEQEEA